MTDKEQSRQLFHWTVESSSVSITGAAEIGGEQTLDWIRDTIGQHLADMDVRYPNCKTDIAEIRKSLACTNGFFWSKTLNVWTGLSYATVKFRIKQSQSPPAPSAPVAVTPRKRAGDALRERYREHIAQAYQNGQLSLDVFTERLDQVTAAIYIDELPPLIADLDPLPADAEVATSSRPPARVPPGKLQFAALGLVLLAFILSVGGFLVSDGIAHVADQGVVPVLLVVGLLLGFIGNGGSGKRP